MTPASRGIDRVDQAVGRERGGGAATLRFPVPTDPGLLGKVFNTQGLVSDPSINALGLTVSNAAEARFGLK